MDIADEDMFVSLSQESRRSARFVDGENDQIDLQTKVFNDPIHGHIELHPLLVKVIDTPQFQRLRNIKQLGANYFVYPGASHHRFEHCIGTCHLAGKLVRHLQRKQLSLGIDEKDILCVEMGALIHDLGHGPFSHMFDMDFLPRMCKDPVPHELTSCKMFEYLIEDNDLKEEFKNYGLGDKDIFFIKELVHGPFQKSKNNEWEYEGRPREKSFLYEIISNHRNKVDVDKWDYFARDCHHLGISNSFDHDRFIHFCRVLTVQGENPQICARDKEGLNLYEMFHTRSVLHRRAYQHRVSITIEKMICDAMCLADKHITYLGKDGIRLSISQAVNDPVAFTKLSDNVFYEILNSSDEHDDMKEARIILQRILKRQLYCFIGHTKPKGSPIQGTFDVCQKMRNEMASFDNELCSNDFVVAVKNFNYGMKEKNPCDQFRFYSKSEPNKPLHIRREEVSEMLPHRFADCEIQVFCKSTEKRGRAEACFKQWCNKREFIMPQIQNGVSDTLTPLKRKDTTPAAAVVAAKKRAIDFQRDGF